MTEKKLDWVYCLKTLGIFFVILGHLNSPFSHFIFSWHMPFFLFISGFFFSPDETFRYQFLKNVKRLMLPYFFYGFIGVAFELVKRVALRRDSLDLILVFRGLFLKMDYNGLEGHYGFLLWFLPALFVAKNIFWFLNKFFRNNLLIIFIISIFLFVLSFKWDLPFSLDNGMNVFIWFLLGRIFYHFFGNMKYDFRHLSFFLLAPLFVILFYEKIPSLDIASKKYSFPLFNILWALLMTVSICIVMRTIFTRLKAPRWFLQFGVSSMFLYVIHPYTNNIAYLVMKRIDIPFRWIFELTISLILLYFLLKIKLFLGVKLKSWKVLKYV